MTRCPPHDRPLEDEPILIVDDERNVVRDVTQLLRGNGFTDIETASDGVMGLDHATDRPRSLIILNHRMPRMNGDEMLARLRQFDNAARVIVISASDEDVLAPLYARLDVDDYVTLPFSSRHLLGRCRLVLDIARRRKRLQDHETDGGHPQ